MARSFKQIFSNFAFSDSGIQLQIVESITSDCGINFQRLLAGFLRDLINI